MVPYRIIPVSSNIKKITRTNISMYSSGQINKCLLTIKSKKSINFIII